MPRTVAYLGVLMGLALLLAICSILVAVHHGGLDDAFISYRYAQNAALGRGLVFNPGERVEGYTNLLYVLMLVPAFVVGLDGTSIYKASVLLSVLASIGVLALLAWHLRTRFGTWASLVGSALFAASPAIWYWNASGMETMWVILLQVAGWVALDRLVDDGDLSMLPVAVVASILLILMRADGFVGPCLLVLYLLMRRQWRDAAVLAAAATLVLVALTLWRQWYYGYPLPNTYYVKVSGGLVPRLIAAAKQVVRYRSMWIYWLLVGFLALGVARMWLKARRLTGDVAGLLLGMGVAAYFLYVGGDALGDRFLLLIIPLGIYGLFAAGLVPERKWTFSRAWAVSALLVYQLAVPPLSVTRVDVNTHELLLGFNSQKLLGTPYWAELGQFLHTREHGKVLAVCAAGMIPFFSGLRTIDMLGLSDEHIAHGPPAVSVFMAGHTKFDPSYVLGRHPDLIASWCRDEEGNMTYGLDRSLWYCDYVPKYALYTADSTPPNGLPKVVEIERDLSRADLPLLFRRGYRYLVLARRPMPGGTGGGTGVSP